MSLTNPPPLVSHTFLSSWEGKIIKAVNKRARTLTEKYTKKAQDVVMVYGRAAEGTLGNVQMKLVDFGHVRGWCLKHLARLVKGYMSWSNSWLTSF